ncbi:hypothetical protein [Alteromonas halophila]|uniref:Solute-binding protein family 3/N-terminal domain-containing protein n=1 Tax=Alteromonas halophila TaxID=516698 RepID=A0A918JL51_9ALTE|nr:hypothetical protein [Alteromonas halophila]GGW82832.1 hypothetical protein GCM10007391_14980 [Alteromonas halophila]
MYRSVCLVIVLALLTMSAPGNAAQSCRPLVVFSFSDITPSNNEQQRLREQVYQSLDSITGSDATTELCHDYTRITLSNIPAQFADKYPSRFTLTDTPAFATFSLSGITPENTIVGQRARPYMLKVPFATYLVNSDETAITLLQSGKISEVIDYAVNIPIYEQALPSVTVARRHATTPVSLLFEVASHRDTFDTVAAPHFTREETPLNTTPNTPSATPVTWLVLNKYFSMTQNALVALHSERKSIQWLDAQLEQYTFTIRQTNGSDAIRQLQENDDICVMGIYPSEERQRFARFSMPTSYFLSPRLYFRSDAIDDKDFAAFTTSAGVLDATAFLSSYSALSVGYSPELLTLLSPVADYLKSRPQRFLQIDVLERERMLALVQKGRLDGFVDFPSHLAEARQHLHDLPALHSFTVSPTPVVGQARAACNHSTLGNNVINAIDGILSNPKQRYAYISLLADAMLAPEQRDLHQAADTQPMQNADEPSPSPSR